MAVAGSVEKQLARCGDHSSSSDATAGHIERGQTVSKARAGAHG
jgi:hypothetical protein